MWFGLDTTQEATVGRWTEGANGHWAYDPRGYPDGDQPATTALPIIYPDSVDPDLMPPEQQHQHGGAE